MACQRGEPSMLEIPESCNLAEQINSHLVGKTIVKVTVNSSPHKFAWLNKNLNDYVLRLSGKQIDNAFARGGMVEVIIGPDKLVFSDGVSLRYSATKADLPPKHQLLLEFANGAFLSASVQMYGGLFLLINGKTDDPYYLRSVEKPSPLTDEFNEKYFQNLLLKSPAEKLSVKAFLTTEQRIPGLGNGTLQDILFNAGLSPKRKLNTLSGEEKKILFTAVKSTLKKMSDHGGRNTETDLFGHPGGYDVILCSKKAESGCPKCGTAIVKEAYMGGSVYYCPSCQK